MWGFFVFFLTYQTLPNMTWHPNSNKHKRTHCGYKQKPSKKQVLALLDMYNVARQMAKVQPVKQNPGAQLKLDL